MDNFSGDYAGLKPGIYLQVGTNIKAIDVNTGGGESWLSLFGFDEYVNTSTLADRESWTHTALTRRVEQLNAVPNGWMQGDNEMDDAPYGLNMRETLAQIDKALQTKEHGAYFYKMYGVGRQITKLVWLDPETVTPDLDTATHKDGIKRFKRDKGKGGEEWILARDLIWFRRPGQKELQSDPAPLEASRKSAEVLYNMARMEDFFFEGAGLPIMLVMVPAGTSDTDKEEMRSRFHRIANALRDTKEIRTMAVREGVTVEQLSFSPRDLDLAASEERNRNKVLAVHQVPQSIAMSNAANYATALSDQIQFANTMATRLEVIAAIFNADANIAADGYSLVVKRNGLPVMQEEEHQRSQSVAALVAAGETLDNAYKILGYDLPDDYEQRPEVEPVQMEPEPEPEIEELPEEEAKSALWYADEKRLTNWLKKRDVSADVGEFNSNELTHLDKLDIYSKVFADAGIHDWRNYP